MERPTSEEKLGAQYIVDTSEETWESKLQALIQQLKCLGSNCDDSKVGKARFATIWNTCSGIRLRAWWVAVQIVIPDDSIEFARIH